MKKLFLFTSLCVASFAQAVTKNDLEGAIRDLDVESVKQIIEGEQFTQREYGRYLSLAEEMIRNREMWLVKVYPKFDSTIKMMRDEKTPYEGSCREAMSILELLSGFLLSAFAGISYLPGSPVESKKIKNTCAVVGLMLFFRGLYDAAKAGGMWRDYQALLQKKYDDAVSIKQLMYTANITEA